MMGIAGIYRHFKGNDYEVLGLAVDAVTGEGLVFYRQLYGTFGYWLRPKAMFFEERITDDGPVVRFTKTGASRENILEKENIFEIPIRHSETEKQYRIVQILAPDGETVFEVRQTE